MAHEPVGPSRRRRRLLVLAVTVLALTIAIPVAWASHQFTDVPDANPFHTEISAIAGAGITGGKTCVPPGTPPTYCPNENVNRQAMAAFMHRGFGRLGYAQGFMNNNTETPTTIASVTIDVGGVPGQTQFVKLDAQALTQITDTTGCPCTTVFIIEREGGPSQIGFPSYVQNEAIGTGGLGFDSGAITTAIAVESGTTHTFNLKAWRIYNTGGLVGGWGTLTATVVPFGPTGGSTLGTAAETAPGTPANPTG